MISEAWALSLGGGSQAPNPMFHFVFLGILLLIFWFLLIQPQKKQKEELQNLINNLKKGDHVVTQSGMHGSIAEVKSSTIIIEVLGKAKIEFEKVAIARVVSPDSK